MEERNLMKKPTIGFIGLGVMGKPMAGHLAKAGYQLVVYDKNGASANRISSEFRQVRAVESPKKVAEFSDIVITMLPTGTHVQEVIRGKEGLIEGYRSGSLHLDTTSAEPWLTMESAGILEKHGVAMVDAPVSGAEQGAIQAELVFMVGGNKKDVSRVTPLLEAMGKQQFHLGPIGSGHTMKCVNNLITAMCFMGTTEGLVIGKRLGLDPHKMIDVLNVSTGMSWNSINHFKQRIFNRKFDDHFKLALMIKDIGIAMKLAGDQGLSLPVADLTRRLWKSAAEESESDSSISEMVRWVENMTGTELVSENQ
jgi:3-hydroxyisobutyrate dehydrogenase-like beta-hydroxyacid dehydrogenase